MTALPLQTFALHFGSLDVSVRINKWNTNKIHVVMFETLKFGQTDFKVCKTIWQESSELNEMTTPFFINEPILLCQ